MIIAFFTEVHAVTPIAAVYLGYQKGQCSKTGTPAQFGVKNGYSLESSQTRPTSHHVIDWPNAHRTRSLLITHSEGQWPTCTLANRVKHAPVAITPLIGKKKHIAPVYQPISDGQWPTLSADYLYYSTYCSIQVQFGGLRSGWDQGAKAPEKGV